MNESDNNQFLGLLAASSVHDIKNSLSMLLTTLEEVIRSTPDQSETLRQQFGVLQGEAARINNDLLYFLGLYRLQNNQLPLQIQSVYVAEFLQEQMLNNSLLFEIRNLTLDLDCDSALMAYFDPSLIAGIINNVLVNAARYAQHRVSVRAAAQPQGFVIEVLDDGRGFPDRMLQQSTGNSERSIDFSTGSTSLGLYFAGEVAAMHRRGDFTGSIALSNRPQGGGCFQVFLP